MDPENTIGVIDAVDLEDDVRRSLPGVSIVRLTWKESVRALIGGGAIGLFLTKSHWSNQARLKQFRLLARESARKSVPTLFVAESKTDYGRICKAMLWAPNVGVAFGRREVQPMVDLLRKRALRNLDAIVNKNEAAFRELMAVRTMPPAPPLNLDQHPLIEKTTGFLRNPSSGRLDAKRIAKAYGEELKRFAAAMHVSPAAVSQTPDSRKYQNFLSYFEKVARIIPMLDSPKDFGAWAKTPNAELKGEAPIEWLFGGAEKAAQLAETVEEVLVGQPD